MQRSDRKAVAVTAGLLVFGVAAAISVASWWHHRHQVGAANEARRHAVLMQDPSYRYGYQRAIADSLGGPGNARLDCRNDLMGDSVFKRRLSFDTAMKGCIDGWVPL
jgi:hypothetical protein